jgi:hypothetical protein
MLQPCSLFLTKWHVYCFLSTACPHTSTDKIPVQQMLHSPHDFIVIIYYLVAHTESHFVVTYFQLVNAPT